MELKIKGHYMISEYGSICLKNIDYVDAKNGYILFNSGTGVNVSKHIADEILEYIESGSPHIDPKTEEELTHKDYIGNHGT